LLLYSNKRPIFFEVRKQEGIETAS
jgi:hypothetical protein